MKVLQLALVGLLGVLVTLGVYTLVYAEGFSYLSNDPEGCVNCHVMRPEFEAWSHSSHKAAAVCNDCHTPHTFLGKWTVKGINGWNHSYAFTTGRYPDPIRIRPLNARVVQDNCVACHEAAISRMTIEPAADGVFCVRCHGNVGHER